MGLRFRVWFRGYMGLRVEIGIKVRGIWGLGYILGLRYRAFGA